MSTNAGATRGKWLGYGGRGWCGSRHLLLLRLVLPFTCSCTGSFATGRCLASGSCCASKTNPQRASEPSSARLSLQAGSLPTPLRGGGGVKTYSRGEKDRGVRPHQFSAGLRELKCDVLISICQKRHWGFKVRAHRYIFLIPTPEPFLAFSTYE